MLAARLTVLPFDSAAAYAADIRASLEQQGASFDAHDILIAGHDQKPRPGRRHRQPA